MDRKKTEKANIDKEALNKILAPFDRGFLIKQIWDEDPGPSRRSTICIRFQRGNWTKLEIMRIKVMLDQFAEGLITSNFNCIAKRIDGVIGKPEGRKVGNYSEAIKELNASPKHIIS